MLTYIPARIDTDARMFMMCYTNVQRNTLAYVYITNAYIYVIEPMAE